MKCEICGKVGSFGRQVSHSKRHSSRRWRPNIQKTRLPLGGTPKRVNICTRCLRTTQKVAK